MANPLFALINQLFTDAMAGATTLLGGSTGMVIVGFLGIALLTGLVAVVYKIWGGSSKKSV